jgi:hypothetical protein
MQHTVLSVAGLKGSLNEYELDLLRQRSVEARREKAKRGELIVTSPAGYIKGEDRLEKDPDPPSPGTGIAGIQQVPRTWLSTANVAVVSRTWTAGSGFCPARPGRLETTTVHHHL